MTAIDGTDCYLVLACPLLESGRSSGDVHLLQKCPVWDENDQYVGDIITACYDWLDWQDYLIPVPGKIGERVLRPDWALVARQKTIPNQTQRRRENMPVYVEWAKNE